MKIIKRKSFFEGHPDEPPPPESEIFRSENYSNFIYLFFKVNIFKFKVKFEKIKTL